MAENAAATAALWAELVPQYFDPDVVRVINGGIPETTRVRVYFCGKFRPADVVRMVQVLELQWDHSQSPVFPIGLLLLIDIQYRILVEALSAVLLRLQPQSISRRSLLR